MAGAQRPLDIEMCFARDWPGFSVCLSVAIRGLPQDMAVPSRCLRRESPGKMKILKITVSYDADLNREDKEITHFLKSLS